MTTEEIRRECGLITSGVAKQDNWLLREGNMDAFCKHILREAWKFENPPNVTYKVRIEILNGERGATEPPIEEEKRYKSPYAD